MDVGEQVQVKRESLELWQGDSMLTPAAIVKLGYPNRFEILDIRVDAKHPEEGEFLVLPCCHHFKVKGNLICHGHPVEHFEPYEIEVTKAEPEPEPVAPLGDRAETSVKFGGASIGALGYIRDDGGGKVYVRLPFFGEVALEGHGSRPVAQLFRGLGWL